MMCTVIIVNLQLHFIPTINIYTSTLSVSSDTQKKQRKNDLPLD